MTEQDHAATLRADIERATAWAEPVIDRLPELTRICFRMSKLVVK